jgi:hypothetical protein
MQRQPEYYTVMVPKQDRHDSDLDRQKKLLELGDHNFFGGGVSYSNLSSSNRVASAPIKVKSAAVQVNKSKNSSDIQTQRQLLALGSVNLFGSGSSPTAELLARRQNRGN